MDRVVKSIHTSFLGQRPYQEVWELQEALRKEILQYEGRNRLLLVEHSPTISLGRGEKGGNLLKDQDWLREEGVDVVETNRGGKITYHGPGQLVAYPVFDLRKFRLGIKEYVHLLESVMLETMRRFGVTGNRKEGCFGVWVGKRKIGSIGIHLRRQVSIHGLSFNVNPKMDHFEWITPCGISDIKMTSLEMEGVDISVLQIIEPFLEAFGSVFGLEIDLDKESEPIQDKLSLDEL